MNSKALAFLVAATERFGAEGQFTNQEMMEWGISKGYTRSDWNFVFDKKYKVGHGRYQLPAVDATKKPDENETDKIYMVTTSSAAAQKESNVVGFNPNANSEFDHVDVPAVDKIYIPFGEHKTLETIIESKAFFPVFISGLSGNGKTFMVEQICAQMKRAMVRCQMSKETDEDSLIGGWRLINGETKFMKGPVLRAMELGALLLVDEVDRSDAGKIMCLQGILEGKPYFVKKTGECIYPASGFNVIVTANTKGKGSDDGRYVAAGVLDDAWLERFPITIEQTYPSATVETKILMGNIAKDRKPTDEDKKFISNLVKWADITRKSFTDGAVNEMITTRRLVHIIKTYLMFGDRKKSIEFCIARFDSDTKNAFTQLYEKIEPDEGVTPVKKDKSTINPTWDGTE